MGEQYIPKIISRSEGHIFKTSIFRSRKQILDNIAKIIGYNQEYGCMEYDVSIRDGSIEGYHDEKLKNRLKESFSYKSSKSQFNSSDDSICTNCSI